MTIADAVRQIGATQETVTQRWINVSPHRTRKKEVEHPRPSPHKKSPDGNVFCLCSALPQPFPFHIDPEPSPVVRLIAEALGLCCEVHGLVGGYTPIMDDDGHPFLERLDVRDKPSVRYRGGAHDMPSQSGTLIPSMMPRFWASEIPAE